MKKHFAVILFILMFASIAQAFTVPEEVQVVSAPKPVASKRDFTCPTPVVKQVKAIDNSKTLKEVKNLKSKLFGKNGVFVRLFDSNVETKKSADAAKLSAEKAEKAITDLNKKLTDKKNGEFAKSRNEMWSVGKEVSNDIWKAVGSLALLLLAVAAALYFFLRRDVKGVAKDVHDYFDRSHLMVTVGGHQVTFLQDKEVLDRKTYQVLMVREGDDTSAAPADFELNEISDRDRAKDSLKRTMREYFNGKLIASADAASVQTVNLVKFYEGNGRLIITKI